MSENVELSDFTEVKLNVGDIFEGVVGNKPEFPKYTTQLINLANQNAQGTRPKVVGQLSELIKECPDRSYSGWKAWYSSKYPDSIDKATEKIGKMVEELKKAIEQIDDEMIAKWAEDLIVTKTSEGLIIQEYVIDYIAGKLRKEWRFSTPEEESRNIDGYIGEVPVQIKPISYLAKKPTVREQIDVETIYYDKTKNSNYVRIYTKLI